MRVEEWEKDGTAALEGETRHDELRRAWFDGWTEGVMWMWGKTRQALRQDGQPESVECSVIHHVSSELVHRMGGVRQLAGSGACAGR